MSDNDHTSQSSYTSDQAELPDYGSEQNEKLENYVPDSPDDPVSTEAGEKYGEAKPFRRIITAQISHD